MEVENQVFGVTIWKCELGILNYKLISANKVAVAMKFKGKLNMKFLTDAEEEDHN